MGSGGFLMGSHCTDRCAILHKEYVFISILATLCDGFLRGSNGFRWVPLCATLHKEYVLLAFWLLCAMGS